jgi:hypothetical protein
LVSDGVILKTVVDPREGGPHAAFEPISDRFRSARDFRSTPGETRTPNLLIRNRTDPAPTSTTPSRSVVPSLGFSPTSAPPIPRSTSPYYPVGLRFGCSSVAVHNDGRVPFDPETEFLPKEPLVRQLQSHSAARSRTILSAACLCDSTDPWRCVRVVTPRRRIRQRRSAARERWGRRRRHRW